MATPEGLREVAGYADAIGPSTRAVIPLDGAGRLAAPTTLVRDAHAAGLQVHVWTFRPEQQFIARDFWHGDDPAVRNEAGSIAEIRAYLAAGIDAFFSDDPALGRAAVDAAQGR
jgi:glycerophosphoryl diester phosphodiesterase